MRYILLKRGCVDIFSQIYPYVSDILDFGVLPYRRLHADVLPFHDWKLPSV